MTIYYLNPLNLPVAAGGVQKLHDHVEILNDAGIDAAVINPPAFRPWWFATRARIVHAPVNLKRGDLLAIPEVYGDALPQIAPGFPRVSVNQNSFMTFENVKRPDYHPYLRCPSLLGILTMSEHDRRYLSSTFPHLLVNRAYYSINPALFGFAEGPRQKKIAYMPRKRKQLAAQIIGSLYAKHALDGWELQEIRGMSHAEVSDVLGTSQLFLSFSQREGFGLPPAEALGRGCYVIGYAGWGGNEFFDSEYSQLVLEDDLEGFVSAVADWTANRGWNAELARAGSSQILRTYSPEIERNSVVDFFRSIRERQPDTGPATAHISVRELVVPARSSLGLMASRVKSGFRRVIDRVAA